MSRTEPTPGQADGLNPDDPGMVMLRQALAGADRKRVLSLCSGDLRGLAGAQQVLDRRESSGGGQPVESRIIALSLKPSLSSTNGGADAAEFDIAALWPRAHLGKDFALQCVARGLLALRPGGRLLCAVRKQKGADSIADFMAELFGNVATLERDRGYRLLCSTLSPESDRTAAEAALGLRYAVTDPLLGDLEFSTAPGVFSRKALDVGTRCLLEHTAREERSPKRVLDLCAGWGALGLWAAKRWESAQVMLVESNYLGSELCSINAEVNGLSDRVKVVGGVGLPKSREEGVLWHATVDLALVNPPTHADAAALAALFAPLAEWLRPGARCLAVAARPQSVRAALDRAGARTLVRQYDRFSVIDAWFE